MMAQEGSFNYLSNDIMQAVEMPYGAGNYSMIILLPQYNKTLDDIIDQLTNENWNRWLSEFYEAEKVQIHLPKFKFEYEDLLNNELINMGMGIAFDPYNADFSKINPARQLYISRVIHKSFIGGETFIPFYVNQPFIFAIKEKYTNSIIFIGKVMEPEYED
jgi:serpin B